MTCPHCAASGLTFTETPPRAYFNGVPIDLPHGLLTILRRLGETGSAPFAALHPDRNALTVQIRNLRKRLPEGMRIVSVPGWGYELSTQPR